MAIRLPMSEHLLVAIRKNRPISPNPRLPIWVHLAIDEACGGSVQRLISRKTNISCPLCVLVRPQNPPLPPSFSMIAVGSPGPKQSSVVWEMDRCATVPNPKCDALRSHRPKYRSCTGGPSQKWLVFRVRRHEFGIPTKAFQNRRE